MQTNRQGFLELLQRYVDGTSSDDEKQMMDYWYDLLDYSPDSRANVLTEEQREALLWAKIQRRLQQGKKPEKMPAPIKWEQQNDP
ncbi:hypothetical protein GCM10027347_29620 [Larkinella harenae]